MKLFSLLIMLCFCTIGLSQSLPIDFETDITTSDFIDFDGGIATVIDNPQSNGINTSTKVAQIIRDGGQPFAGSKISLEANLDFTTLNTISMKVFTSAPVGTMIKFKLEGNGAAERDAFTSVSNEWEVITWDFTGTSTNFNDIVFMFDFGNVGDGSATSTFLFDDVEQLFGGNQIDLPVDFEGNDINYTMTDFDGPISMLTTDPLDADNNVMKVIKTVNSGASSGTTIGTPAGFATNIPLTLTDSKMNVRVWSASAGTPVRLKVEDSNDPTRTCETETNTTLSGEWEVLEFDFNNQALGTELLSVGLSMGWTYNMASIFFNFGTDGASAGELTFYFDDVRFGPGTTSTDAKLIEGLTYFPNPTSDEWMINSPNEKINQIELYGLNGQLLKTLYPNANHAQIDAINLNKGLYIVKITTNASTQIVKLLKE
ncbi:MAG: T9SS type A sorting domain-containing protein [Saprospiraceae bacterium]|nr:T9SS type A sorting domain-containing protein [Saprospiraceae bacterium]